MMRGGEREEVSFPMHPRGNPDEFLVCRPRRYRVARPTRHPVPRFSSQWYVRCALAPVGAIHAGGTAFGVGWHYVKHDYITPRPQHDRNSNGLESPLI